MLPRWQIARAGDEKNASPAMKRASERSCARVTKAASISRLVVAFSTWSCSPKVRAGSCTSRNVVSVIESLVGLRSTPTRTAFGSSVCRSASRLAVTSALKKLMPVALPPGRARLATRPSLTGSSPTPKTIGIVVVAALVAIAANVVPTIAITAPRRRTRSATSAGTRSYWFSSQWYSTDTFRPST